VKTKFSSLLATFLLFPPVFSFAAEKAADLDRDPHLLGWWKFDGETGNKIVDSSRFKRPCTLEGGLDPAKALVEGRVGKALEFDGKDDRIRVTGWKGVTGTRPRTIAVWLRTQRPRGEIVSWGKRDFGQMCMIRFFRSRVGIIPRGGYLYMKEPVHDGRWHHVAVVVREAESPNLYEDATLYLDGEPAVIDDIGLLDLWPLNTGKELDVAIARGFKGALDDLRIYDRALSEDEITRLFKAPEPRKKTKEKR